MTHRSTWQLFYWLLAGSLLGLGLIGFDILFLSIPCLILGSSLTAFGIKRWGARQLWAMFLGLGLVPTLFLLNDIITAPPTCPPGGLTIPADAPAGTVLSCGGPLPTLYYILLACFGLIALIAGTWPLVRARTATREPVQ